MKAHLPWKRETFDPTSWVSHLASLLPNGEVRGYGVRQTQVRILSAPLPGCANFNLSIFICSVQFSSVFSRSVVSNSLWPHGLQHARPPCPSPTPVVYPSSWPLSRWCHPTTSSSIIPFSSCLQSFPGSGSFQMLFMRWLKYWSFSFNSGPSNERPGLISFKVDWVDLFAGQGTLNSLLQHHISSSVNCS